MAVIRNPEGIAHPRYCDPECSLWVNDAIEPSLIGWTSVLQTIPESVDHPVALAYGGDCSECVEGLAAMAQRVTIPTQLVGNPGGIPEWHYDCEPCQAFRVVLLQRHPELFGRF